MTRPTLLLLALLLAGCGARRDRDGAPAAGLEVHLETLVHDGRERDFEVHAPRAVLRSTDRVPAVLVLHGGGGHAQSAVDMTGFSDKALAAGFIAVYPEGTGPIAGRFLTWNARHCCGYAMENHIDDVGFVAALVDRLVADFPVDPDRIFVTGMSNGAMMTHRLGTELPDRIAGIAPVVGGLFGDERTPSSPVAAIMVNGLLDESIPADGGPTGGRFADSWDGTPLAPVTWQFEFWADKNGCAGEAESADTPALRHWRHDCPGGAPVELYIVEDNGHAWPGGERGGRLGDRPSNALDATDVIWAFFESAR